LYRNSQELAILKVDFAVSNSSAVKNTTRMGKNQGILSVSIYDFME